MADTKDYAATIALRVTSEGTAQDVDEALQARLSEFYPLDYEVAVPTDVRITVGELEEMFVRIQRLVDEDGNVAGWVVDLNGSPLADTSSRFFAEHRETDARAFAEELAALAITEVRQVEDDAL